MRNRIAITAALALALACAAPALADTTEPDPMPVRVTTPTDRRVAWAPNPGPQTRFLATSAYEALYGGAAGGGKSDALVAGALRHVHNPRYAAITFRREFPELERTLIERSRTLYPAADPLARYNEAKHFWRFASGARVFFAHLQHEHDTKAHQGAEYQFIGFDELTHFTESQYRYMLSRGRSSDGIPVRIRATTNPGGEGHEWVFRRWGPWLDPDYPTDGVVLRPRYAEDGTRLPPAEPGQVLYYLTRRDGSDEWVPRGTRDADGNEALSRVFIPARLEDNPRGDPTYAAKLATLDAVTRAQLRDGNWLVRPAAGLLFKRQWFEIVDAAPADAQRIRYWDRAATENGGDWTRGVRLARSGGTYYVEHVASTRSRPAGVKSLVKQTAELDGHSVEIGIEQDPGQAGVYETDDYIRELAGFTVRKHPVTKDKITRAKPVSAQAEAGNIKIVRGPWNEAFLAEIEAFPSKDSHDDQVDALSGAFAALSTARKFFLV